MNLNANHYRFLDACSEQYPNQVEFSKSTVRKICDTAGIPFPSWLIRKPQFKAGYGTYSMNLLFLVIILNQLHLQCKLFKLSRQFQFQHLLLV